MDLIDLGRKGVSKESLLHLAQSMGLPVSKMAALLPVTERTIQRYAPKEHFDRVVSENILHLAEVVARGIEVFEDNDRFMTWIDQPSTALGGRSPKSLLSSRFGIDMVLDELTRIEHGVAA
jgi:putative toxin-antitoxin system antitoxin component (TIGR02293 family)